MEIVIRASHCERETCLSFHNCNTYLSSEPGPGTVSKPHVVRPRVIGLDARRPGALLGLHRRAAPNGTKTRVGHRACIWPLQAPVSAPPSAKAANEVTETTQAVSVAVICSEVSGHLVFVGSRRVFSLFSSFVFLFSLPQASPQLLTWDHESRHWSWQG